MLPLCGLEILAWLRYPRKIRLVHMGGQIYIYIIYIQHRLFIGLLDLEETNVDYFFEKCLPVTTNLNDATMLEMVALAEVLWTQC